MSTLTFAPNAPKKKNPTIKMDETKENRKWKNDLQNRFQENMDKETNSENISALNIPNSFQLRTPKKKDPLMNYSSDELLKLSNYQQ